MKIAKIYWSGAKKCTSEAKIILLQQYTSILKFCRTTPDNCQVSIFSPDPINAEVLFPPLPVRKDVDCM